MVRSPSPAPRLRFRRFFGPRFRSNASGYPCRILLECLASQRTHTRMCLKHEPICRVKYSCRWLLLLNCLFAGVSQATETSTSQPVQVEYHSATDIFNLLDNLPDWLPGYTAPEYGKYWEAHIGLNKADRAALAAYAEFRQRTAPVARAASAGDVLVPDLFAPPLTRDLDGFAQFFFNTGDFQAGVNAAIAVQAPQDRAMLREYFSRFGPGAIHLVAARSHFDAQRTTLASQFALPGVTRLADDICKFYGIGKVPTFVARFVWWPDPDRTQAKVRGRYILLQGPADDLADRSPMDWPPITLHEYTHYASASQSKAQRQRLSAAFLQGCPAAAALPNPLNALEEPLAIYWGQYRFEHDVRGGVLSADSEWYFKPLPDHIAKAIAVAFPSAKPAPSLEDSALVSTAAAACLQQTANK